MVRLGGPEIRKARCNVADAHDAGDVFMDRDSSIAPLLEMRRRFKAVMDVLDYIFRNGTSLSRSVELTVQWDRILAPCLSCYAGGFFVLFRIRDLVIFLRTVSDVHHRLSDFIHGVVVHRRDEAFRGWRIGCGRIPLFTRISGFSLTWCPLLFFCSVSLMSHLEVLGCLLILLGLTDTRI